MSGFGDFLKEAVAWLYEFWPLRIVTDWEQGVRVRAGRATALLTSENGLFGSGLHVFWPGFGEIYVDDVNIRTIETEPQTVQGVTFSLGIKFRTKDLRAQYLKIHDPDDTVADEARSAAGLAALEHGLTLETAAEFGPRVLEQIKKETRGWGQDVLAVRLINVTEAPALRLLGVSS